MMWMKLPSFPTFRASGQPSVILFLMEFLGVFLRKTDSKPVFHQPTPNPQFWVGDPANYEENDGVLKWSKHETICDLQPGRYRTVDFVFFESIGLNWYSRIAIYHPHMVYLLTSMLDVSWFSCRYIYKIHEWHGYS